MTGLPKKMSLRPGPPDFLDLPWDKPLAQWEGDCARLEELPRGPSRHPVVFVNYDGVLYALKEMPPGSAQREYEALCQIEAVRLPAVIPAGYVQTETGPNGASVLITRYLERSLPYSLLFTRSSLESYREHLLDAIAGLLVQLHLAGVFWGDCSLSNTLFRRDAGTLRAYLVDAETTEFYPDDFSPTLRLHDLQIMEENICGDLLDLDAAGELPSIEPGVPLDATGAYIRLRYQSLWEEITSEDIINPGEHYRIQERIRALNALGFSVGDVQLAATDGGDQLRFQVMVTDRNFHRQWLFGLTGLDVEEMQARQLVNEINELRAMLARTNNRSTPLSVAAHHWLENIYKPVVARLETMIDASTTPAELYCQVLEHKWYLSEKAAHDVGHQAAADDYLARFGDLPR